MYLRGQGDRPQVKKGGNKMETRIEFDYRGYNARRYSRPWGALVEVNGTKLNYDFDAGSYLGDDAGGSVIIVCETGDVVATGQRDYRGNGSRNDLYIVETGGKLKEVDRKEAFDHLQNSKKENVSPLAKFSDEELIKEMKKRGLLKGEI